MRHVSQNRVSAAFCLVLRTPIKQGAFRCTNSHAFFVPRPRQTLTLGVVAVATVTSAGPNAASKSDTYFSGMSVTATCNITRQEDTAYDNHQSSLVANLVFVVDIEGSSKRETALEAWGDGSAMLVAM